MHRATTQGSNATNRYYNSGAQMSRTEVNDSPFRFREFLGSVEGHVWRVGRPTTPFLVSLHRGASNAFNADTRSRQCCYTALVSFRPMMPATIRPIDASLIGSVDSPSRRMPMAAVPTAPMPVHTA